MNVAVQESHRGLGGGQAPVAGDDGDTRESLDWAYPPFIIAASAAAMGSSVTVFFTVYGLTLLKQDLHPNPTQMPPQT